jgi:ribosomal protein S18 acetylase RimI-like enzyme
VSPHPPTVLIRAVGPADAVTFRAVRLRALRDHPEAFGRAPEEIDGVEVLAECFARASAELDFVLGAFDGDALVGMIGCHREPLVKHRHTAYIWGVYVVPERRGAGLGGRLLDVCLGRAREWPDLDSVWLEVTTTNRDARALYASRGFKSVAIKPRTLKVGDRYHDEELMSLQLVRVEAAMRARDGVATAREVGRYRITVGDGRSTEALVAAGQYGYAHSCLDSESFPARHFGGERAREIVLLELDRSLPSDAIIAAAARLGLERPTYEDALYFGVAHPEAQRERPIVFLHDPWFGFFGRRDVLCLWSNAGRRELGLEGYDDPRDPTHRFAFVQPDGVRS